MGGSPQIQPKVTGGLRLSLKWSRQNLVPALLIRQPQKARQQNWPFPRLHAARVWCCVLLFPVPEAGVCAVPGNSVLGYSLSLWHSWFKPETSMGCCYKIKLLFSWWGELKIIPFYLLCWVTARQLEGKINEEEEYKVFVRRWTYVTWTCVLYIIHSLSEKTSGTEWGSPGQQGQDGRRNGLSAWEEGPGTNSCEIPGMLLVCWELLEEVHVLLDTLLSHGTKYLFFKSKKPFLPDTWGLFYWNQSLTTVYVTRRISSCYVISFFK